jgi:hypothetical protein
MNDVNQGRKAATKRRVLRGLLALGAASLSFASPLAATSLASNAGGADKSRPATFGDCKNENAGVHNGYDCEESVSVQVSAA